MRELTAEEKEFIEQNTEQDITKTALKKVKNIDLRFCVEQIYGRQKARRKFPFLLQENILFPPRLNLEQSSSEKTAKYKTHIIDGKTMQDLTGGFGIDTIFFAHRFEKVYYYEQNEDLFHLAERNFRELGLNIECRLGNVIERENFPHSDFIYLDPSRRREHKKVFLIGDCEPDLLAIKDKLFQYGDRILVKFSPLLDIEQAIRQLVDVEKVYVVAVDNECRELLFILKRGSQNPAVTCVDITDAACPSFTYIYNDEVMINFVEDDYIKTSQYLYEPNAAIMKGRAFNYMSHFDFKKVAVNSHLFLSDTKIDFPFGKCFRIEEIREFGSKTLNELRHKDVKANIVARNFPFSANDIRQKGRIKEGDLDYLFFTADKFGTKVVIACRKEK